MRKLREEEKLEALPEAIHTYLSDRIENKELDLPLLPDTTLQIVTLCRSEDADAAQLTELLHRDQSLAGNVLRIANSPISGSQEKIVSLQQAVSRLGLTRVREISLAASVEGLIFDCGARKNLVHKLWSHCLTAALIAKEIARHRRENVEEAFLCGLLHDMGKPVLVQSLFDYEKAEEEKLGDACFFLAFEEFHAPVASALIEEWGLPAQIAEAIRCHHDWRQADQARAQAAIMYLADYQAHKLQETLKRLTGEFDAAVLEELNIYPEDLEALEAKGERTLEYVEAMMQ
ncbi:MAG: HDOD domain-containing protein [Planctomycetota bacterium]|jgi:putative nucleotidyltransferase with HDIG domain